MNIRLNEIPFTKAETYIKICESVEGNLLQISTASSQPVGQNEVSAWNHDYYKILLYQDNKRIDYTYECDRSEIKITGNQVSGRITFLDNNTFIFKFKGASVKLLPMHAISTKIVKPDGQILLMDFNGMCTHQVRAGHSCNVTCWEEEDKEVFFAMFGDKYYSLLFSGENEYRFAMRFARAEERWDGELPEYSAALNQFNCELNAWMGKMPSVPEKYLETARMAWYINWSCIAPAQDNLQRKSMLMSKNWMNSVWAWDNCFNALAVIEADPELAWNQLLLFFDKQADSGMLPDSINDLKTIFGYVKPPIYGWTILKLIERTDKSKVKDYVKACYLPLCKLTNWWYDERDYDSDGMCQYHHGNDSGWDNSSAFDQGYPTEGADLAGHLVLQTEALGKMAEILALSDESKKWQEKSKNQLDNLLKQGIRNNRFFSPLDGSNDANPCASLLNYIAMVIGHRMPQPVLAQCTEDLKTRFLTVNGLATEAVDSDKYESDGYWRGPIWAPSTYLIFDGLVDAGESELAQTIAERFCDMCMKEPGMFENYDAVTGKGLRCPGYSWTSSVFLLMANWLHIQKENK